MTAVIPLLVGAVLHDVNRTQEKAAVYGQLEAEIRINRIGGVGFEKGEGIPVFLPVGKFAHNDLDFAGDLHAFGHQDFDFAQRAVEVQIHLFASQFGVEQVDFGAAQ